MATGDQLARNQHLRRIHRHARTNRSNQACNVVLLAHRMLSELPAATVFPFRFAVRLFRR
jgi:hypothetical protein